LAGTGLGGVGDWGVGFGERLVFVEKKGVCLSLGGGGGGKGGGGARERETKREREEKRESERERGL